MKPVLRLFTLFAFLSILPGARAADPSGTWKGAIDVQGTSMPMTINLKSDGNTVTGTIDGLPNSPIEIHDGTIAGDAVTFWINADYQGQTYKVLYKGKIAADQISFDLGTEDGSWNAPLTVKKSMPDTAAAPPQPAVRRERQLERHLRSQRHSDGTHFSPQDRRQRGDGFGRAHRRAALGSA